MKHDWNKSEQQEYDAMMSDVLHSTTVSRDRNRLLVERVNDAIQAHRSWAKDLLEDMINRGAGSIIRAEIKKDVVLVDVDGRVLAKSRTVGTKRSTANGMYDQQVLLETLTWDELEKKRREWKQQENTYADNVRIADKLMSLRAKGVNTPQEALDQIGVSLDQFLGSAAA